MDFLNMLLSSGMRHAYLLFCNKKQKNKSAKSRIKYISRKYRGVSLSNKCKILVLSSNEVSMFHMLKYTVITKRKR